MQKKHILTFGVLSFSLFFAVQSQAQTTDLLPEEQCFQHLDNALKQQKVFQNIDLQQVKKINELESDTIESENFSLQSYEDFKNIATTPIPGIEEDLRYFPHKLNRTAHEYLIEPEIHKANRNGTIGIIKYKNDTETSLGNIDSDPEEEIIKGYFLDTQYATFGRQSDLRFSFPTRDPKTHPAYDYPTGPPYKDIREYVLFSSHLNPEFGGDFLSCGLVQVIPQGEYILKANSAHRKSIQWKNYGHDKADTLNLETELLDDNFRMVTSDFMVSAKEKDPEKGFNYDQDLVKFSALIFYLQ